MNNVGINLFISQLRKAVGPREFVVEVTDNISDICFALTSVLS